jgi:D-xylose transport system substrate-binding protein
MQTRAGALIFAALIAAGCSRPGPENPSPGSTGSARKIRIGFSMDTLKEERWHRDRDLLVRRAGELGAEVLVQAANGNDALQNAQAENMLTQGVDVLLVAPHNGKTAAFIVEAAHRAGVPVIAYDRLINNADVDLYMSFDNERVGEMQAEYLVARRPKGNYVVIGGASTDNNALLYHQGQMKVLEPSVRNGDIKIVSDQWARDWLAVEALKIMENALTRSANRVDAVVAANDGVAGGKIDVPSILLPPVAVDRDNILSTVIADGYQKLEDVYRDVPRDLWPKKP